MSTCKTCVYLGRSLTNETICRKNVPKVLPRSSGWPKVNIEHGWCAEGMHEIGPDKSVTPPVMDTLG